MEQSRPIWTTNLPDPAFVATADSGCCEPGGAFSLFGDYIVGRQIELVPDLRIVQAWRVASWAPGVYSVTRCELLERGSATQLVFDHTGFPAGTAQDLASGWYAHYWEPMRKMLG